NRPLTAGSTWSPRSAGRPADSAPHWCWPAVAAVSTRPWWYAGPADAGPSPGDRSTAASLHHVTAPSRHHVTASPPGRPCAGASAVRRRPGARSVGWTRLPEPGGPLLTVDPADFARTM